MFAVVLILPLGLAIGIVQRRLEQRQSSLQLFLRNQLDIDRKIIDQRRLLGSVEPKLRGFLFGTDDFTNKKEFIAYIQEVQEKINDFWQRYRSNFIASKRPFLLNILEKNQELDLIEKEEFVVNELRRKSEGLLVTIRLYVEPTTNDPPPNHASFLGGLDEQTSTILDKFDQLADLRYIFGQRVVFVISGENDRQYGFFNSLFVMLLAVSLLFIILQYFFIYHPLSDIMAFLKDLKDGKRGQRLYFSSPVREIKESEEIINTLVSEAEKTEVKK